MRTPKVNPVSPVARTRPITRSDKFMYQSDIDPAVIIHSSKTHRTASEAFRDADYATPIWRCETEWDRTKEYLKWIVMWLAVFFVLYSVAMWFEGVVK
jgi:hypothetical protein